MFGRRRTKRFRPISKEPVEVQIMGPGYLEIAQASDVGERGLGMHLPSDLSVGGVDEQVEMIITVPGEPPVFIRGLIRGIDRLHHKQRLAVEFVDPSEKALSCLQRYLARRGGQANAR